MVHEHAAALGGHGRPGHPHDPFDSASMASILELEAEVLAAFVDQGAALVEEICAREDVRVTRVIDLGSGPGVGTIRLAERFDAATVVAVDASAAMLGRVVERVAEAGKNVETRQIDLNGDLRVLGGADVVWASMSIHHVDDEVATLGQVAGLLAPRRGVLAIVERGGPIAVRMADDLGRPGIWDRLERSWSRWFADNLGSLPGAANADRYPAILAAAGFEVVVEQTMEVLVGSPMDAPALRFASHHLRRSRDLLRGYVDEADLVALGSVLGDGGAADRTAWNQAEISADRRVLVARPASE